MRVKKICHQNGYSAKCLPAGLNPHVKITGSKFKSYFRGGTGKGIFSSHVRFVCAGEVFDGTHKAGTPIFCTGIPLLFSLCPGEVGHSVSIVGTDLNLHVIYPANERIFILNPDGSITEVSAITGSGGEYTKVLGSCGKVPTRLPVTGGGMAPTRPTFPGLPLTLGLGLALLGLRMRRFAG